MVNNYCIDSEQINDITTHYKVGDLNLNGDFFSQKFCCSRLQFPNLQLRIVSKQPTNAKNSKIKRKSTQIGLLKFLQHPNLPRLFDVMETNDQVYCIIDASESQNFISRIQTLEVYNEKMIFTWAEQICSALQYLHFNNIVHRCLTIESLFFDQNDNILLDGYYLSYIDEPRLLRLLIEDHPYACSPEMLVGAQSDPSSDMWSLGMLIFELLTGTKPFPGESLGDIYKQILSFTAVDFDNFETLSFQAKEFISKLLKFDPNDRLSASSAKKAAFFCCENGNEIHLDYAFKTFERSSHSEFSFGKIDRVSELIVDEAISKVYDEFLNLEKEINFYENENNQVILEYNTVEFEDLNAKEKQNLNDESFVSYNSDNLNSQISN